MHFEKKWNRKFTDQSTLLGALIIFLILVITIEIMYIYTSADFWTVKFIDIINAIAQLATAGAFALAVYQYTKSKKSERQAILIQECRELISQMSTIANFFEKSSEHDLDRTSFFVEKMVSLGGSFNAIFKELAEDTHKAIVRMRWQEMYFSDLRRAMERWNLKLILSDIGFDNNGYESFEKIYRFSLMQHKKPDSAISNDPFDQYRELKFIVTQPQVKAVLDRKKSIGNHFQFFERHFFTNSELKDHLYGYLNIIDVRARAPVLAVINETLDTTLKDILLSQTEQNKNTNHNANGLNKVDRTA